MPLKRAYRRILWILFMSIIFSGVRGQSPHVPLERLSIEDGLSQSTVKSILQDSRGVLWFGTEDGLNSYDGYRFTHFKHKPHRPNTLNGSTVTDILEDSRGNLWIGTNNGLSKLDTRTLTITSYPLRIDDHSGGGEHILDMIIDARGNLVIAFYKAILYFDPRTGGSIVHRFNEAMLSKIGGRKTQTLMPFSKEQVWIGNENGIFIYNVANQEFEPLDGPLGTACQGREVYKLFKDEDDQVWAATDSGLLQFDLKRNELRSIEFAPPILPDQLQIFDLIKDRRGYLWVTTQGSIPYILQPGLNQLEPLSIRFDDENSQAPSLTVMFEDESGILWIGSYGGIFKFDPDRWKFQHFKESQTQSSTMEDIGGIRAFTELDDQTILVASSGNGMHLFDPATKKLKSLNENFNQLIPDFSNNIKSLHCDSHGYLWIGTWHDGLYRMRMADSTVEHIVPSPVHPQGIQSSGIRSLSEDPDGNIWIGTYNGLNRYEHKTGEYTLYHSSDKLGSLTDPGVQIVFADAAGNIWAGTNRGGLNKLNRNNGSWQQYHYDPDDTTGISYNYITSIAELPEGTLWVGTYGGGLNKLDTRTGQITHYNSSSGLPNDVVYGLLPDARERLWISSNSGVTCFDPRTEDFRDYDMHDGLQSNEFNSGAYYKSGAGQLFFGGINGFNAFFPDSIKDNAHIPKLIFTDFLMGNQPVIPGAQSPLKVPVNSTDRITLKHDQTVFSFEFAALNYTDPKKNQYAYILEGFDETWQHLGARNFITFTSIDAGNYTLKVRGSNNDGIWNDEGLSLEITVLPPWWKTGWAYTLYAVLFLGILFIWRKQVIHKERLKAKLQMEHLKLEKISELDRVKSTFFENISHEFRTPLTLIQGPLESIYKKGVSKALQAPYKVMINNTRRLHQLIDQLLDLSKLESGKMRLQASYQDLVPVVKSVFEMYKDQNIDEDLELQLDLECDSLWLYFDRDKVEKILYNLLSNAYKFTREGSIQLGVKQINQNNSVFAQIDLRDTGPGIPQEMQEKIFDRFYQSRQGMSSHPGTGIGLALTKELVQLHQGIISLYSAMGYGSTFTVKLPVVQRDKIIPGLKPRVSRYFELPQDPVSDDEWQKKSPAPDNSFTILVVEDQVELRGFLKDILAEQYLVMTAADGLQAWDLAIEHLPDLIISDILMPNMDGLTLCHQLKQDRRTSHIPVVLLTAKTGKPHRIKGLQTGADDYLTKPFDEDELRALLKNRLAQREILRQQFSRSIYLEPEKLAITPADETFLNQALRAMEQNMDNTEFRVEQFLREMGMSRSQLHRKLASLTGQSTTEFMRSIRLKRAAQLLKEDHGNVSQVADAVGFNRVSTFITEFKKLYQITPLQYRKKHLQKQVK